MTPLEKARRIIDLHAAIKGREAHLQKFDEARANAFSVEIKITGRNSSGYPETMVETKQVFSKGCPSDIAAIVIGRLSEEHVQKLKLLKTELAELEAGFR